MLLVTILTSYASFSQTSIDSCTCIPNSQLRKAAYRIKRGELDSIKVGLLTEKVDTLASMNQTLTRRIEGKDSTLALYSRLAANWDQIEATYKKEIGNVDEQNLVQRGQITDLMRQLKASRRKTIFVAAGGIALAVLVVMVHK